MANGYLDFEIHIDNSDTDTYPLSIRSPAGEVRTAFNIPFSQHSIPRYLAQLHTLPSREIREFGQDLFDSLLTGDARSLYYESQREAEHRNQGLRIKLTILPPEVAMLPWEYLYDPRETEFVCLVRNTPIVRYLELTQPIRTLTIAPPLSVLGIAVSPDDLPKLDLERERQCIERALHLLPDKVKITWLEEQSWQALQHAMRQGPWHILHFVGHGKFDPNINEGMLVLADDNGNAHALSATHVGRILADHESLRLVILNACEGAVGDQEDIFSSTAATLMRRGIPAVLAMQYAISDRAAIEFSQAFYGSMADGSPVDAAVTDARKAITFALSDSAEWGTPILHMRAPDGRIFPEEIVTPPIVRTPTFKQMAFFSMIVLAIIFAFFYASQKSIVTIASTDHDEPVNLSTSPSLPSLDESISITTTIQELVPERMPDEGFNVAIAQIGEITANGVEQTESTRLFTEALGHYLSSQTESDDFGLKVNVSNKNMPIVDDETEAKTLAKQTNADLVVYGKVLPITENIRKFLPSFYVTERIGGSDAGGYNQFSTPISYTTEYNSKEQLTSILETRAAILTNFVKGLVYFNVHNPKFLAAENSFQIAVNAAEKLPPFEGEEVLYLMLAAAQREQKLPRKYDQALDNLKKARELNPQYARAGIGMGNNFYDQSGTDKSISQEDVALLLEQAELEYNWALNEAQDAPPTAYIHTKGNIGLGNVWIARAKEAEDFTLLESSVDTAITYYQMAINDHLQNPDAIELQRIAAYAYRNLGWAYDFKGDFSASKVAYEKCTSLPTDEKIKAECQTELNAIETLK